MIYTRMIQHLQSNPLDQASWWEDAMSGHQNHWSGWDDSRWSAHGSDWRAEPRSKPHWSRHQYAHWSSRSADSRSEPHGSGHPDGRSSRRRRGELSLGSRFGWKWEEVPETEELQWWQRITARIEADLGKIPSWWWEQQIKKAEEVGIVLAPRKAWHVKKNSGAL